MQKPSTLLEWTLREPQNDRLETEGGKSYPKFKYKKPELKPGFICCFDISIE